MTLDKLMRITTAALAAALLILVYSAGAGAQQAPINVHGSSLSGSLTSVSCPTTSSPDSCDKETISGPIQKVINGLPSGGNLSVSLYVDLTTAVRAPVSGSCFPTQGTGSITNGAATTSLNFEVQGWLCNPGPPSSACLVGPLSFSIGTGLGNFLTATGTGTFNAQSPSCYGTANDVQVTMKGVIIK